MNVLRLAAIVSTLFTLTCSASAAVPEEGRYKTTVVGTRTPCERNPRICQPGQQRQAPLGASGSAAPGDGGSGTGGGGQAGPTSEQKCNQLRGRLREMAEQDATIRRDLQANEEKSRALARQRRDVDSENVRLDEALARARQRAHVSEDAEFIAGARVVARCSGPKRSAACEQVSEAMRTSADKGSAAYLAYLSAKASSESSQDRFQSVVEQQGNAQREAQALRAKKAKIDAERNSIVRQLQLCRAR